MKNLVAYFIIALFTLSAFSCSEEEIINSDETLLTPELSAINESSKFIIERGVGVLTETPGSRVTVSLRLEGVIYDEGIVYVSGSSSSGSGRADVHWDTYECDTPSCFQLSDSFNITVPSDGKISIRGEHDSGEYGEGDVRLQIRVDGSIVYNKLMKKDSRLFY